MLMCAPLVVVWCHFGDAVVNSDYKRTALVAPCAYPAGFGPYSVTVATPKVVPVSANLYNPVSSSRFCEDSCKNTFT